ncbi:pseudaminic acid synthase [Candidatus Protochlamydia sp. R18]|uniref:pseudaminic acid synthase n=1 Tax=Candidatus Protochlamydia sp. R18 TaxID=1353977 RepID=UPI0005AAC0E1|nr:pseudaminic acid synthase [Candidatus Protochlamydia sp. R18]
MDISIGSKKIGPEHPPFIIAELSGNHNGSLERALKLVEEAAQAGAHAVKLQTYTPDTITLNVRRSEFLIEEKSSLWTGRYLYDLYQEAHMPWEWHQPIFEKCKVLGLVAFSTPFDESAVDFLEALDVPCYKIASPEIVDLPLIRKVASLGKPVLLSTGGANLEEITEAVNAARQVGCQDLILLKCTAAYPAKSIDMHLRTIFHMSENFQVLVGLSDHTLGIGASIASLAFGCCLIEKHLTLSRKEGGVDSVFSLEPEELKLLVNESKNAWEALGQIHYGPLAVEQTTHSHRPSLYFVKDLEQGEKIQLHHIRSVRPNKGLPPKEIDKIIGLTINQSIAMGTPVTWDLFNMV